MQDNLNFWNKLNNNGFDLIYLFELKTQKSVSLNLSDNMAKICILETLDVI